MKGLVGLLVLMTVAVCIGSFALMKMRMKEFVAEEKKVKFQDVKLRVIEDILNEYGKEKQLIESGMQKEKDAQEELHKALNELNNNEALKKDLLACQEVKKTSTDKMASVQMELKALQDASAKEKADWEGEIATLNEKLNKQSPICNYIKAGASVPGICPEMKPEPKPEPPKPTEGKKPEPPKPQEASPDAPQPEAPKPEDPKPEAPKPEAPKPEAPKPEAPNPKAPKQEPAKPEPAKL